MTYDLGASYRAARERIGELVGAHVAAADRMVPATPDWTVHHVLAHLAGVAQDIATGNMTGAPGDDWTAAQVQRGAGRSVTDLVALWSEHAPTLEDVLSGPHGGRASAAVMDVHCHEADLRHAFGLAADLPADFLTWSAQAMRDRLDTQVAEAGLSAVTIDIDDFVWFRARLGRRTEAEVRGYPWRSHGTAVDPSPYLDVFFIFGRAAQSLGEAARS